MAFRLHSLCHHRNVALLCLFFKYIPGNCSDHLSSLVHKLNKFNRTTILAERLSNLTLEIVRYWWTFYAKSFITCPSPCLGPSFPVEPDLQNINAISDFIFCFLKSTTGIDLHRLFFFSFAHILSYLLSVKVYEKIKKPWY